MRYWDFVDWLFALFVTVCVLALVGLGVYAIADGMSDGAGYVTNKYYDDPDWSCAKTCIRTDECWTIEVDSEPWWNNSTCVSESVYYTISIGDYFEGT